MKLVLDLSPAQETLVQETARRLGITPEALAAALLSNALAGSADDFDRAARKVLEKNKELYERLSR